MRQVLNQKDPPRRSRLQQLLLLLAVGGGAGFSPVAPGTVGCLWGIILSRIYKAPGSLGIEIALALLGTAAAVPLCTLAERILGHKDDRRIVADEYFTFPLSLLGISFTLPHVTVAFVINRILDILKPPPARSAQSLSRGWGIVTDDLISSLYTLILMQLLIRWVNL